MRLVTKQNGVALILVLMLSGVLAAVVIFQQYRLQHRLRQAEQISAYIDAQLAAVSVREKLVYTLNTSGIWFFGATPSAVSQAGLPADFNFYGENFNMDNVQLRITDGSGMVSLLPFERESWQLLFQYAEAAEPAKLADELADWIDTDDFVHLNGAERFEYSAANLPRNDIPQSIDELALLRSMTPQLWKKIRPHIVYIGSGQVNPMFVPIGMLPVLLGTERAELVAAHRQQPGASNNEQIDQVDSFMQGYPSRNLYIEIESRNDKAAYKESFVLIRGIGTPEFSYITAYRPGYGDANF